MPPKRKTDTPGTPFGSLAEIDEAYRYQLLVEAVMDYAIYLLDPDGYISSWNAGAERFKGYKAHEVIGRHFSCFYTEQDRAAGLPAKALATAASEGRFEAEGWRVRKDGTQFWTSAIIDPIRNEAGKLLGYAKITRDITDKKQSADDLVATREALHQSQKLEALGLLTGGVAHDFNNLLMVIRGSAELLRQPRLSESKRQQYIDAISTTSDRAAHLTRQLLAYARKQPLRPATFDVKKCIEGMQDLFHATCGSSIRIAYDMAAAPCLVHVDRNQLETCILNIIINARDAMPSGGSLTLAVASVDGVPAGRHRAAVPGPHVAIAIADTGAGIASDVIDRVFEPFFTTKGPGHGTGLGLSQVFGFISQSGGQVDVASAPGQGTTFTLYLAQSQSTAYDDILSPQACLYEGAARPKHRILLVEDNPEVRDIVTCLLQELGQEVSAASDGHAALDILRRHDGAFDLLITDVVMPELSGLELARQAQAQWPRMHIVLATGYSHALADLGSTDFAMLHKPYSVEALTRVLDTIRPAA